jgi:D-alanyl-lipoteichoic acid acyltransferase DltB (MBOAT superfamily)
MPAPRDVRCRVDGGMAAGPYRFTVVLRGQETHLPVPAVRRDFAEFSLGLLASRLGRRRAMVVTGVILNLLLLDYFKYATFLADNFNLLVGTNLQFDKIALPIGI